MSARSIWALGPLLVLTFAAPMGCQKSESKAEGGASAPAGPAVARVGAEVITAAEVEARIAEQSPFMQARFKDPAQRKEFVNSLVRTKVLAQEARRRGLHETPEVRHRIEQLLVQELVRQAFDEKQATFTPDELKGYYDRNIGEFVRPERVRVQHIFVTAAADDKAARTKARAKVAELLGQLKANDAKAAANAPDHATYKVTLFADLAREVSEDKSSQPLGGDLRYLARDEMAKTYSEEFAAAAFALTEPNALSPVIETPQGFHVVRFVNRQPAVDRAFDAPGVQDQIRSRLFREQRSKSFDEYVEKLKTEAQVSIDEAELAQVKVSTPTPPPGMPIMPPTGVNPVPAAAPAAAPQK